MEDSAPWDRRLDESDEEWFLFSRFLDQPDTNVTRFAPEVNYSPRTLQAIATRRRWRARRAALDRHLHLERVGAAEDAARAAGEKHALVLDGAMDYLLDELQRMRTDDVHLAPKDFATFMEKTIELQRAIHGEPTKRTVVDLRNMTDERMAALEALLEGAPEIPEAEG